MNMSTIKKRKLAAVVAVCEMFTKKRPSVKKVSWRQQPKVGWIKK